MICERCGCSIPMTETELQDEHGKDYILYECDECGYLVMQYVFWG